MERFAAHPRHEFNHAVEKVWSGVGINQMLQPYLLYCREALNLRYSLLFEFARFAISANASYVFEALQSVEGNRF